MLVLLGVVPAVRYMEATERGNVRLAHDGGVLVNDEAVRVLLEGRDPYQASYAEAVAANGAADLLVQRQVDVFGHCVFTPAELGSAFSDLVLWVQLGIKPTP